MQVVLAALGVEGDWPLIIAFVILAAYTYQSDLRAPALIAFVKDRWSTSRSSSRSSTSRRSSAASGRSSTPQRRLCRRTRPSRER
jgi:hypothetical protein